MRQTEGIIYLSERRECFQTDTFRSYFTLPNPTSTSPFTSLIKFLDNTLSAQKTSIFLADDDYVIILLPLVGAVEVFYQNESNILNPGELACFSIKNQDEILIQNPYEAELINYLEIWIKPEKQMPHGKYFYEFDLEKNVNSLFQIAKNYLTEKVFMANLVGGKKAFFRLRIAHLYLSSMVLLKFKIDFWKLAQDFLSGIWMNLKSKVWRMKILFW